MYLKLALIAALVQPILAADLKWVLDFFWLQTCQMPNWVNVYDGSGNLGCTNISSFSDGYTVYSVKKINDFDRYKVSLYQDVACTEWWQDIGPGKWRERCL